MLGPVLNEGENVEQPSVVMIRRYVEVKVKLHPSLMPNFGGDAILCGDVNYDSRSKSQRIKPRNPVSARTTCSAAAPIVPANTLPSTIGHNGFMSWCMKLSRRTCDTPPMTPATSD